ncbi:protein kinase domain-containing protein [Paractinoplanes hotanensis]|uniref:non-specific serine/threonine protein kinase n=1 Tax=Paractinoplanes hotanensis TaxID=2906497 RepID=A0ABT0YDM8_9ACTN|nr:protein kinase [Actinoplanes hotanensis]MCM4083597.1 protein kinase [Actinoplanes hotanensis]
MSGSSAPSDRGGPRRPDPPAGLVADRYRLLDLLGEGGMGRVWEARDELLGRAVAVKEISPEGLSTTELGDLRERAIREARAIAQIDHPHVVRIFDVVEHDGTLWIVMELVRAISLYDEVSRNGPLDPRRAAQLGLDLVGALQAAHRAGVLHRDVKPANVLLGRDERVVLTDFGLATSASDSAMTRAGVMLGSPSYLAPERAHDEPATAAADLWSLGATLFTAVEGHPPYERSSPMATLAALMVDPPAAPTRAGILEPVLEALLERDPSARATAEEAAELLRYVLSAPLPHHPVTTAAVVVPETPARNRRRRRGPVLALVAGATAVTAAVGVTIVAGRDPQDAQARPVPSLTPDVVRIPSAAPSRTEASARPSATPSPTPSRTVSPTKQPSPSRTAPATRTPTSRPPVAAPVRVTFEAESFTDNFGTEASFPDGASGGRVVGKTNNGDWVGYRNRSLAGVRKVTLRYTAGSGDTVVEIRSDSASGELLARVTLSGTTDFSAFATVTAGLSGRSSGPLFIAFPGPRASDIDTVTLSS